MTATGKTFRNLLRGVQNWLPGILPPSATRFPARDRFRRGSLEVERLEDRNLLDGTAKPPVLFVVEGRVYEQEYHNRVREVGFTHSGANFEWNERHLATFPAAASGGSYARSHGQAYLGELVTNQELFLKWNNPERGVNWGWPWVGSDQGIHAFVRGGPGTPYSFSLETEGMMVNLDRAPRQDWLHAAWAGHTRFQEPGIKLLPPEISAYSGWTTTATFQWEGETYSLARFREGISAVGIRSYISQNASTGPAIHTGQLTARTTLKVAINWGEKPIAKIAALPPSNVGQEVTVTSLSYDPDNPGTEEGRGILDWQWTVQLPDRTEQRFSGSTFTFRPTLKGDYTIKLRVIDDEGVREETTVDWKVESTIPHAEIRPLQQAITVKAKTPPIVIESLAYDLDDGRGPEPGAGIVWYHWKVTDPLGRVYEQQGSDAGLVYTPQFETNTNRKYKVELVVTDNEGVLSETTVYEFDVEGAHPDNFTQTRSYFQEVLSELLGMGKRLIFKNQFASSTGTMRDQDPIVWREKFTTFTHHPLIEYWDGMPIDVAKESNKLKSTWPPDLDKRNPLRWEFFDAHGSNSNEKHGNFRPDIRWFHQIILSGNAKAPGHEIWYSRMQHYQFTLPWLIDGEYAGDPDNSTPRYFKYQPGASQPIKTTFKPTDIIYNWRTLRVIVKYEEIVEKNGHSKSIYTHYSPEIDPKLLSILGDVGRGRSMGGPLPVPFPGEALTKPQAIPPSPWEEDAVGENRRILEENAHMLAFMDFTPSLHEESPLPEIDAGGTAHQNSNDHDIIRGETDASSDTPVSLSMPLGDSKVDDLFAPDLLQILLHFDPFEGR